MEEKKISLKHAGLAFLLFLVASTFAFAAIMFSFVVFDSAQYGPMLEDMDAFQLEPMGLLLSLIGTAIGGLAAFLYVRSKIGWDGLNFTALSKKQVGLTLVLMVPILGFGQLITWAMEVFSVSPDPQLMMQAWVNAADTPIGAIALVFIVLGAPFFEEVLFRGFMQPACTQRWGMWPGILIASAIFGMIHGTDSWAILPTFVIGVSCGWLRERTGGLSAPVLLHAVNNLVAMVSMVWLY
jgi:membrane protease YdiL (CAAX protease family)